MRRAEGTPDRQYSSKGSGADYGVSSKYIDLDYAYFETADKNISNDNISIDINPYREPTETVRIGTGGEGARWVQWYLWRFGLLLTNGRPDSTKITGHIDEECQAAIKESQRRLGLSGKEIDGIVGIITRTLYKKL